MKSSIESAVMNLRKAGKQMPPLPKSRTSRSQESRSNGRAVAKARQSRRSFRNSNPDSVIMTTIMPETLPEITPEQVRAIVKEEQRQRRREAREKEAREARVREHRAREARQREAAEARKVAPLPATTVSPRVARLERRAEPALQPIREHGREAGDAEVITEPATTRTEVPTREPDLRRPRARTGEAVEITLDALFAEGYLRPEGHAGVLSEEFRRIKRPLLANAFGQGLPAARDGERIMITSSLPSEGKSFCAIHLALSIASEVDNSVVLVEADVAKPTVLEKLGIRPRRGLANWYEDQSIDVADITLSTNVPGLKIVPAGMNAPDSIDMLASRAMGTFFDRLRQAFPNHLIVVDAPPLLPATETKVLATIMGQVVVVVEAGETAKSVVADALEMLKDIEIVGLVLNKSTHQSKNAGYGYGYGY